MAAIDELFERLSGEEYALAFKADEEAGEQICEVMEKIHYRLKSVLPRCYWPLLAVACADIDDPWSEFMRETETTSAEYIAG